MEKTPNHISDKPFVTQVQSKAYSNITVMQEGPETLELASSAEVATGLFAMMLLSCTQ